MPPLMMLLGELIARVFLLARLNFLPCLRALMLRLAMIFVLLSRVGGEYLLPPFIADLVSLDHRLLD